MHRDAVGLVARREDRLESHIVAARDFVVHLDRAMATRRLYSPGAAPFRDVMDHLWLQFQTAVEEGDITLVLGASEIICDGEVILSREKRDDAFHFPLYRDGLREFRIAAEMPREELELLLDVFEAERRGLLDSTEDTVGFLWRCNLNGVTYSAIDGIGDVEAGEDELQGLVGNDFDSLVAEVTSRFQEPENPVTGQSYAFVLDADVDLQLSDVHYEADSERKPFESQDMVFRLAPEEANRLRSEAGEETEGERLDRFVEILFAILTDPESTIPGRKLGNVLQRILEGYWNAEDVAALEIMLQRLKEASISAPEAEKRDTANRVLADFLGMERLRETLGRVDSGTLSAKTAKALWKGSAEEGWQYLFRVWARGVSDEVRPHLEDYLRRSLVDQPELLREVFASGESARITAGLELLGDRAVLLYAEDVLSMVRHPEEKVRARAVALAGSLGGKKIEKILWQVLETDSAAPVRLIALRRLIVSSGASAAPRLMSLTAREGFRQRPMKERIRVVRAVGEIGGADAEELFLSWIPSKWLWQGRDFESAELAVRGLLSLGQNGLDQVRALTASRSPVAKIARRLLGEPPLEEDEDTAALEALTAKENGE